MYVQCRLGVPGVSGHRHGSGAPLLHVQHLHVAAVCAPSNQEDGGDEGADSPVSEMKVDPCV